MENINIDGIMDKLAKQWMLKEISLPIKFLEDKETIIFRCLNDLLRQKHDRKELLLPNFNGTKTVAIFSDYGGESKDSKYYTYTFTFVDYDALAPFAKGMKEIREKYGLDDPFKEISFKDLRYGPLARSMDEYLNFTNNFINGLVFTLIVDKKVISLSGSNSKEDLDYLIKRLKDNGLGEWKGKVAEKHQRIIQVIAYFCKLLVGSGKKIFWMTDHDSIVANDKKAESASKMLVNAIYACKDSNEYEMIGYSPKPFDKDEELYFTDILSISDLVAGSIEHYYTRRELLKELTVNKHANKVLRWLAVQGVGLKKLTVQIISENDSIRASEVSFELKSPLSNVRYIDLSYPVELKDS